MKIRSQNVFIATAFFGCMNMGMAHAQYYGNPYTRADGTVQIIQQQQQQQQAEAHRYYYQPAPSGQQRVGVETNTKKPVYVLAFFWLGQHRSQSNSQQSVS
jgi:hypothetical protein